MLCFEVALKGRGLEPLTADVVFNTEMLPVG
jgi:hypothetical protein